MSTVPASLALALALVACVDADDTTLDPDETTDSIDQEVSTCLPVWSHICNWRGTFFRNVPLDYTVWLPEGSRVAVVASCPNDQRYFVYRNGWYGTVYGPYFSPC